MQHQQSQSINTTRHRIISYGSLLLTPLLNPYILRTPFTYKGTGMTQEHKTIDTTWEDAPADSALSLAEEAKRASLMAQWAYEEDTPAASAHRPEPLYTQAEMDARIAAATKHRSGPAGNMLLLKDFDRGMQLTALADKYGISTAAVRARIRNSGRSVRKCPHCGGGL